MKNYKKVFINVALMSATAFGAVAQVKIGSNPTTIDANANLQIQSTDGSQMIVTKNNGSLGIATLTPTEKLTVGGNGLFTNTGDFSFSKYISAGGVTAQIGASSPSSSFGSGAFLGTVSNHAVNFLVSNVPVTRLFGSSFEPNGSNLVQLGSDLNRWNTVYSGGGGMDAKNVSSDYVASRFESQGGVVTQVGSSSPTSAFGSGAFLGTVSNHAVNFLVSNVPVTRLFGSSFEPNGSNLVQLGNDSNRWNTLYVGGGGIDAKNVSSDYVLSTFTSKEDVQSVMGSASSVYSLGACGVAGTYTNHPFNILINNRGAVSINEARIAPFFNNVMSLGSTSNRFSVVYAVNGTIQTSDRRLKENIKPIAHGLADILKIEAVSFDWKDKTNEKTKLGFIAQDLQKIIPEVISGKESKDAYLGVNYAELTPVLVKAIQEQQAMIEALKLENQSLKTAINQIEKLKEEMVSIKNQMSNTQARGLGK